MNSAYAVVDEGWLTGVVIVLDVLVECEKETDARDILQLRRNLQVGRTCRDERVRSTRPRCFPTVHILPISVTLSFPGMQVL